MSYIRASRAAAGINHVIGLIAILALSFACGTPVQAQSGPLTTVQDLYNTCTATDVRQDVCLAYIDGVADWMSHIAQSAPAYGMCRPSNTTYEAVKQACVLWAAAHPEHWADRAYIGVGLAIQERWPCR